MNVETKVLSQSVNSNKEECDKDKVKSWGLHFFSQFDIYQKKVIALRMEQSAIKRPNCKRNETKVTSKRDVDLFCFGSR